MKKLLLVSAIALAASPAFAAPDATKGGSSNAAYVQVGIGDLLGNGVGIAMPANHPAKPGDLAKVVSFEGGPIDKTDLVLGGADGNSYIAIQGNVLSETWKHTIAGGAGVGTEIYAYRQIKEPMPNFPHFGGEVIAKVPGLAASNAVYFGEWAPWDGSTGTAHDPDLGMDSSLRTVFYVGENPTTSMPNLTNVAYDVVGIQKYNPDTQAGVYTGTLTANFSGTSGAITGTLNGVNFSGTSISSDGSFSNSSTITGKFYGNSAEALAGMYDASGVANDMAFGGARQ
ncbi:Slam-dependent surface lipoprotein [Maridesulfovibrio sp.]|uniref:Slam-dependent surface lipoprotein n=1 Tax=Maridesulfovibrio sp. TaxID=2795000 RepID=UPI0029C9CF65|nr:Slam-dependent surface lipoprotein [Maridesulfovibrio sp.]